MLDNDPVPNKEGASDTDPARVVLKTGETIEATHHLINTDRWVCVYTGAQSDGISQKIPPANVARIEMVDEDKRTRDDISAGDNVTARGEQWVVRNVENGMFSLAPATGAARDICPEPRPVVGEVLDVAAAEVQR